MICDLGFQKEWWLLEFAKMLWASSSIQNTQSKIQNQKTNIPNPKSKMIKSLSHYVIVDRIGAGGMGEVYLAEDSRLGRKVAIKILPTNFTSDEDRVRRFALEARSASALNHPNIITIYDIGQADGNHYIATEFVEGETLRQIVQRAPIPADLALDLALQAAGALGAAHAAGIVHRDIKPENLMRRPDGYLKILDFGLAKLTEQVHTGDLESPTRSLFQTAPGVVMGTIAYMSPEQARGLAVDSRSDLFSLGVVFYEMLTGKRPFTGETASDTLVSILDREHAGLSLYLSEVPPELESIVTKLLAKDVTMRYQTAAGLVTDLKRIKTKVDSGAVAPLLKSGDLDPDAQETPTASLTVENTLADPFATSLSAAARTDEKTAEATKPNTTSPAPQTRVRWLIASIALFMLIAIPAVFFVINQFQNPGRIDSIAVLPFVNEGGDQNTEQLSEGITEGLINSLSQLGSLSVKSRNSVFRLKSKDADAETIGRDLGVGAVLVGRVQQRGDELVVKTELVASKDGSQIWGEQFRHRISDLTSLQEQLVTSIASRLQRRLSTDDIEKIASGTRNGEAYQHYLRGRYYWNIGTPQALKQADEYFEKAAGLDPTFAKAIAGCAASHAFGADYQLAPSQSMPKAKQGALSALKRDYRLASAHLVLARVSWMYDRDYATAERKFRQALDLAPSDAIGYEQYSQFLASTGRLDEAKAAIERAQSLDPASPQIKLTAGMVLYFQRKYDQSLDALKDAAKLDPKFAPAHEWMALAYERKVLKLEAIEEFLRARVIAIDRPDYLSGLKSAYAGAGWSGFWQKELDHLQKQALECHVPATQFADVYLRLEDRRQALVWLEKAVDERDGRVVALNVDPAYDSLRGDERLQKLVRRVSGTQ